MPIVDPPKRASTARTPATRVRRGEPSAGLRNPYDRVYPRHRISETGRARLTEIQVRQIAETVGFPPTPALHMAQICHGESNFYPGVVQDDPGDGNVGWGLAQLTPNAWGALALRWLAEMGGIEQMLNPVKNLTLARKLYLNARGFSPWYGTRYLDLSSRASKSAGQFAAGADAAAGTDPRRTVAVPYLFERGTRKGEREHSWDALARLAEPVNFRRWACLNTLHFASDDELRAAAPSVVIHGDEGWLVSRPTWEWSARGRVNTQVTFQVLSDRWGILPNAVVVLADQGALNGRYLVASARDPLFSETTEVTLRRPVPKRPEPARETRTVTTTGGGGGSAATVASGGKITAAHLRSLTPKLVIDRIVLPVARKHGINRTVTQNDAANAAHGPTSSGSRSDHQGPPDVAWAADMSNGYNTPQENALAADLAEMFGFANKGAGSFTRVSIGGMSFQLLWHVEDHWDHVHFGVQA